MLGIKIGEKHTYKDWGLKWLTPYKITYPEAKTHVIEIPGADDVLDLTEAINGRVRYGQRQMEFTFEMDDIDYFDFEERRNEIAMYLHGKKHPVTLDTDPLYYYNARLALDYDKDEKTGSTLKITGVASPYKYNQFSSGDEWLWDPFNFDTDTVYQSTAIAVNGHRTVPLPPTAIPVSPTFTSTESCAVTFNEQTDTIPGGSIEYISPYVELGNTRNILEFSGNTVISILYRGGAL